MPIDRRPREDVPHEINTSGYVAHSLEAALGRRPPNRQLRGTEGEAQCPWLNGRGRRHSAAKLQ